MFSSLIMPFKAYLELVNNYAMPLLIPKPKPPSHVFRGGDVQPFSGEHQPSLQNNRRGENLYGDVAIGSRDTRATEEEQNKLTKSKFILGVVKCKDCMKPRCLYFDTLPKRVG